MQPNVLVMYGVPLEYKTCSFIVMVLVITYKLLML